MTTPDDAPHFPYVPLDVQARLAALTEAGQWQEVEILARQELTRTVAAIRRMRQELDSLKRCRETLRHVRDTARKYGA